VKLSPFNAQLLPQTSDFSYGFQYIFALLNPKTGLRKWLAVKFLGCHWFWPWNTTDLLLKMGGTCALGDI